MPHFYSEAVLFSEFGLGYFTTPSTKEAMNRKHAFASGSHAIELTAHLTIHSRRIRFSRQHIIPFSLAQAASRRLQPLCIRRHPYVQDGDHIRWLSCLVVSSGCVLDQTWSRCILRLTRTSLNPSRSSFVCSGRVSGWAFRRVWRESLCSLGILREKI